LPAQLLQKGSGHWTWLVVVDGLDEISDPAQRAALIGQLAVRTRDKETNLRLLATTRPLQAAELDPFRGTTAGMYQLEPFSRERLHDFARRWFDNSEHETPQAAEFLHQIQQVGLSELIRAPLLATIAAIVYGQQPTAPLPSSRYVLYQSYLAYLQSARAEATSEQWRRIRNRIKGIPGADTRSLDYARGHLSQLVTHLAESAVGGEVDLCPTALNWIERHSGRSWIAIPDWQALVAGLLDSTGLFVHTASGQRFIHHSFAEHLAGQAASNSLPPDFYPTAPEYAKVLQNALKNDPIAIAALVHHSYGYPIAEPLLGWLETGQAESWTLVGELLAEGIRTSKYEEHVALFLETFRQQPASRSLLAPGARDFWDIASSLSGRTALCFLEQIAADPTCKAEYRIRAAGALPPAASESAVAAFRAVITAPESSFADRGEACYALAELSADHSDEAAEVLRAVIHNPASSNSDRARVAARLADVGSGYVEEAAAALRGIIASAQVSAGDRASAADDLGGLGPGYVEEAAAVLRGIIASAQVSAGDRASAADDLGGLGPDYVEEAAAALRGIIASAQVTADDRASAA
jgi:hypothetical protein